jgi:hypothetical protein
MADIGEPVRRIEVLPITPPVLPRRDAPTPTPAAPEPARTVLLAVTMSRPTDRKVDTVGSSLPG